MDQEETKRIWKELSRRLDALESKTNNLRPDDPRRTALERLSARYRRFSIVAMAMALVSVLYIFTDVFPERYRMLNSCVSCCFFLVCSIMDYSLMRNISMINVISMPVAEVCRMSQEFRRRHHMFMIVTIPMAISVVGLIILANIDNKYMLYAIGVGFAVGLACGLQQYIMFMRDYRQIGD